MARNRQRAKERKQKLHRENVPGSLDHASAGVDEVEASIVAGGEGEPSSSESGSDGAPAPVAGEELDREQLGAGAGDVATRESARPEKPSGTRLGNFLRACSAELQRVQWPDRRQVGQATAVVFGFVVAAGAFLGLADVVAQRIVDFIL